MAQLVTATFILISLTIFTAAAPSDAPPPELQSGTGLFPRPHYLPQQNNNLLSWLGSSFSRLPSLFSPRRRPPSYNFNHHSFPPSEIILADPPSQEIDDEEPSQHEEESLGEHEALNAGHQQQFHVQQQQQQLYIKKQPEQLNQQMVGPPIEVVKSQMISYNHQAMNHLFQPIQLPAQQLQQYQTVGPIGQNSVQQYTTAAVNLAHQPQNSNNFVQQSQAQAVVKQQQQPALQNEPKTPENNYGAVFHDIQQKPPVFDLNQLIGGGSNLGLQSSQSNSYQLLGQENAPIPAQAVYQVATPTQASYQINQQQIQPSKVASNSSPQVQIKQSSEGGNPVFEVIADADAPSYDGHPFDINKLIAMIEPGAVVDAAPVPSSGEHESREVFQEG